MHANRRALILPVLPCVLLLFLAWADVSRGQVIIFVDGSATGLNDGTSWSNAFTDLQSALAAAGAGSEIWVARGTYRPAGPGGDRDASFALKSDVAIYGGFAGAESTLFPGGETHRSQRDVAANLTVLCGDLNGDDEPDWGNRYDNSYSVVTANGTDLTAVLDGFIIRGGGNNDPYALLEQQYGGGIRGWISSTFTVANCTILDNQSRIAGGGIFIDSRLGFATRITNCTIANNRVRGGGGGIAVAARSSSGVIIANSTVSNNSAFYGGGIYCLSPGSPLVEPQSLIIANCAITGNSAEDSGGALAFNSDNEVLVVNCTLAGNFSPNGRSVACSGYLYQPFPSRIDILNSIVWDGPCLLWNDDESIITITYSNTSTGLEGEGNIYLDPMFEDVGQDNYRLSPCSPSIDAANADAYPPVLSLVDHDGNPRFVDDPGTSNTGVGDAPALDMGAFEFQGPTSPPAPAIPQNVMAAAHCDAVRLTWDEASGATSYVIQRNTIDNLMTASVLGTSSINSYADFSAERRVNYWYWITGTREGCSGKPGTATPGHRRFIPGDMDSDCDVDQEDFGLLQACFRGTGEPQIEPGCIDARLDSDTDVDLEDVAIFLACFGGPNQPPPATCPEF